MRRRSRKLDRLLAELHDPRADVRLAAVHSLDLLNLDGDRPPRPSARQINQVFRAVTTLLRRDPEIDVRFGAAYVLTFWFETRAPIALLPVLEDTSEEPRVRGQAAEGIGNVLNGGYTDCPGSPALRARAIASLRRGLGDPAPDVRFWCLYALGTMKATEARAEIERMAATDHALCPYMWRVGHEAEDVLTYWETGTWPDRDFERE